MNRREVDGREGGREVDGREGGRLVALSSAPMDSDRVQSATSVFV